MFSQTVEYALRAMMHLASTGGAAETGDKIASATRVPPGYLSKVMRDLVLAGLVRSFRGPNGGFTLARPVDDISILDVVTAVDPIRRIDRCPIDDPHHTDLCALHRRLDDALAIVEQTFRATSLADVLRGNGRSGGCRHLKPPQSLDQPGDSHAPAA